MFSHRHSRKISGPTDIRTILAGLRQGEAIRINGMSPPFVVVDRDRTPDGDRRLRFRALDKRYRVTLSSAMGEEFLLEDCDGSMDLRVFFLGFADDQYIVSDCRADEYLGRIR